MSKLHDPKPIGTGRDWPVRVGPGEAGTGQQAGTGLTGSGREGPGGADPSLAEPGRGTHVPLLYAGMYSFWLWLNTLITGT